MGDFIFVFLFLVVFGSLLLYYLEKCPHQWRLIDKGDLSRREKGSNSEWKKYGYYTVHECEHCKKLKKEEIKIV